MRVLVLGGTREATRLADALGQAGVPAIFSYAGRIEAVRAQAVPHRVGGFGGSAGLAAFLRTERISHVVDATHPFAATIKANAVRAAASAGAWHLALLRPPWRAGTGDRWTRVPDLAAAPAALPEDPCTVFLGIGRQGVEAFADRPAHRYLLRFVDPPDRPLCLPNHRLLIGRPPFSEADETALFRREKVSVIVAKDAGGSGGMAKLGAARALGLPVLLIDRPPPPDAKTVPRVEDALAWLGLAPKPGADHDADLGV
ncbi:MAG: cobalt-precorrin-6A reductase [Pseudomonadota bacterium]